MSDANKIDTPALGEEENIRSSPWEAGGEEYQATAYRGQRQGFIWFSCANNSEDRALPIVNLREIEPGGARDHTAWLHFSGMTVELRGSHLREVAYRLWLGRCTSIHEIRPGQKAKPGAPVIERIAFRVPPPREPETARREKMH